jgi:acetylornithine deacetylase
VWASRQGGGVTLSTHLDTVPPYYRRASPAAGCTAAARAMPRDRRGHAGRADALVRAGEERVDVLLVVGEEKGSDGARAANTLAPPATTWSTASPPRAGWPAAPKGSLRVTVRTAGREAHSAYAHLGRAPSSR